MAISMNMIVIIVVAVGCVIILGVLIVLAVSLVNRNGIFSQEFHAGGGFIASKGECATAPPTYPELYSDWDGKSKKLSTVVQYHCGYVPETPVAKAVECRQRWGWEETYVNMRACNLDTEGKAIKNSFERSSQLRGCHRSEPPPAGRYFRDWNRLRWEEGTVINYRCSAQADSPLIMTVECNPNQKWVVTHERKVSCECVKKPPLYDKFKDQLVWDSSSTWMGTTIGYRCSTNPNSRFWKLIVCDISGEWTVNETRKC